MPIGISDLIVRADGRVEETEKKLLHKIAREVEVDTAPVSTRARPKISKRASLDCSQIHDRRPPNPHLFDLSHSPGI